MPKLWRGRRPAPMPLAKPAWDLRGHRFHRPNAGSDALGKAAVALADGLLDRLKGLEAIGAAAGVDADALGRAMIDGDEHRRLALASDDGGQVGAPHEIDPLGGDGAVVGSRAPRPAH